MKLGEKPRKIWKKSTDLKSGYNRFSDKVSRLMLLDYAWKKVVGKKEKCWNLVAVNKKTLQVAVKLSVARNELVARQQTLLKEINKYFTKPWIEKIEIVTYLGDQHE